MRFLSIFPRKDIRQKTQSPQTLLPTLWQEVEEIGLHQTMPIFCAFETAKRRTYLENVYRIGFGNNKMEVINFKTVHEINQTVFVVKDGAIKTATITGVLFTDFPYQYKLIDAESNVLFRDEDNVFDTVEKAIKDLVLRYTERLAAQYDADLAKI